MPKIKHPQTVSTLTPETPLVIMGHVIGPYGVRGWIKVHPYTEYVDGLLDYQHWWLNEKNEDCWHEVPLLTGCINGNILNVQLEGYNDRTQAAQLKGVQIAVPRCYLPALPDNGDQGYYWSDLVGLKVINLQNEVFGKIVGLFETGANDVLRISSSDEGTKTKEILIPVIDQYIVKIDLKLKQIMVDWNKDF